ncbi:MAG: phosphoglucosamine mutase [Synechococcus sp.]
MADHATPPLGVPHHPSQVAFGTDGLRGRVGTTITPALALQVGYWCGRLFPHEGPVLIGMDSRSSGAMVMAALTAGLTASGREVWTLGLCATPAVPLLIRRCGAAGGLMVSASHNPPHDNGIKVFGADGYKVCPELQRAIETGLRGEAAETDAVMTTACAPAHHRPELLQHYRDALLASVPSQGLAGIKVVLDLCWGSATALGAEVFQALGADLTVLHGEPDGRRINVGCGSTHLELLREAVISSGAAMGFAFDGDADRMLAVDGHGRVVDGDHVLFLWGSALQDQGALPEQRLVATVMSNLGFERAWQARGGVLERTAVGDQHVHAAMVSSGAALGGEQSGHILSSAHGLAGDGVLTALQIATLCHQRQLSLAAWRDQSFQSYPQKLVNVRVADKERRTDWQACKPLADAVTHAEAAMAGHGRVLVRASGTEPLLRVMVEAAAQADVDHWSQHLAQLADQHLNAA